MQIVTTSNTAGAPSGRVAAPRRRGASGAMRWQRGAELGCDVQRMHTNQAGCNCNKQEHKCGVRCWVAGGHASATTSGFVRAPEPMPMPLLSSAYSSILYAAPNQQDFRHMSTTPAPRIANAPPRVQPLPRLVKVTWPHRHELIQRDKYKLTESDPAIRLHLL